MRSRLALGLVALALVLLALASSAPLPVVADSGPVVSPHVRARVQREGRARVIVQLRLPSTHVPEGHLSAASAVRQRLDIDALQSQVIARLRGPHRILRRFGTVPFVAMEVGPGALADLEASPNHVAQVVEDALHWPTLAQSGPLVQADQAWARGFDGTGTVVAILDTGVDKTHPFLAGRVVEEACYSTTFDPSTTVCPNGAEEQVGSGAGVSCAIADCHHGTHVAGIAAGAGASVSGVAKGAQIMSVQIFSRFDSASFCSPFPTPCLASYTSDQIMGLERVNALRGQYTFAAVNMSLGGALFSTNCDSQPQKAIIDTLRSFGIATVIAAGNNGSTNQLATPGCISTAVSVGSTTKTDGVSSFSNMATFLSLLAPGSSINSSVPGGGFAFLSGTSMAAPHVTGAFAVLKHAAPDATVSEVLGALQSTGLPVTDTRPGGGGVTKSRIRISEAVTALVGPTLPAVTITATTSTVPESGPGSGVFTVSRSGPTSAALTVNYGVGGTAVSGLDYQTLSGSVTIPIGQASATIPVTPINDATVEGQETVVVTLTANAAYTVGNPANATVSIQDDDVAAPTCPAEVVVDNLAPGQSDAKRSFTGAWASSGVAGAFGVNASIYASSGGPDSYTWRTGVLNASSACTYTVYVWWTANTNRTPAAPYTVSGQTAGPLTKPFDQRVNGGQWNLHGTYTFPAGAQGVVTVAEGPGITVADAVRFVAASGDTTPPADVSGFGVTNPGTGARLDLAWTNPGGDFAGTVILRRAGSAVTDTPTTGQTYSAGTTVGSSTVVYAAGGAAHADTGLTNGTTYHYKVFAHDAARNYASGVAGSGTPSAPTVTVAATTPTVPEQGPGSGAFTVSRNGPTTAALTVGYGVSGTASAGLDYQALSGSVTIPIGQASAMILVTPVNDGTVEGSETVVVTLTANGAYTIGTPSYATVSIQDDDVAAPCPAEIIVDNLAPGQSDAQRSFTGGWATSGVAGAFGVNASIYASSGGPDSYTWRTGVLNASSACTYTVYVWWTANTNRTPAAPYTVSGQTAGPLTKPFDQRVNGGQWNLHGTYTFPAGAQGVVTVAEGPGITVADAVRFVLGP